MTHLTYLDDTYTFEGNATVLETKESERGVVVLLNETIFYPQGGGQPADSGEMQLGDRLFIVTDVRLDEEGKVWHFGDFKKDWFQNSDTVVLKINKDRRLYHAKLHSAGHLLDCAVEKMGIQGLVPTKGFHFPDGPYVEYEGLLENPTEWVQEIDKTINELVAQDLKIRSTQLSAKEAEQQGIWAPEGKSARVISFAGFPGCGCGGTHVRSSAEIGKIAIRKIKCKKGVTRIAYALSEIKNPIV